MSDEITTCAKCAKNLEKGWMYCPGCGLLLTSKGETAKCVSCERLFAVKKSWQKYCSTKCRNDDYWKAHKVVKVDRQIPTQEKL